MHYRDECLKRLIKNLHKKRLSSKNMVLNLQLDNAKSCMQNINLNLDYHEEEKSKL